MIKWLSNVALCLGAGVIWLYGNILMGNVIALEYLGVLKGYPWFVTWTVAILPSISQLYITEQFSNEDGEQLDALSMVFAVFVALVVDLGGPMLGFFIVSGLPFNMLTFIAALIVAAFSSILCQHVAFVRARALLGYAPKRKKKHHLQENLQQKKQQGTPRYHPNGKGNHHEVEELEFLN